MWFVRWFLGSWLSQSEIQQRSSSSWESAAAWGPSSLPAALVTGLCCAYVWGRLKPLVSPHEDDKSEYIIQDLKNAKSFLTNLWNAKAPGGPHNTETISKAGEDVLLHRAPGSAKSRSTSESITGTLTVITGEVGSLRRKMRALARDEEEPVHHVTEAASATALLQARLPVTSRLLGQAFELARQAIALDPHATLQLGSWGLIMQSEGEVKLLRLQDGDAPVLLDSFREEDNDLRVEGLFLRGVQMRAAIDDNCAVALRSKTLLKDEAGWMDALIVWPPLVTLHKAKSLLYATKIVEFKGVTATVRSNLIPVSFNRKPKHEDHTGLYLVAAIAFLVALMPSALWLPIFGQIGMVFLPVFQMAAVILGWNVGHFLLVGEWPSTGGDREVKLDSEAELKEFGSNIYKYISPWDSAVRMEMADLERQLAQKLESQPSVSNVGMFAQQPDYRTEYWRKGLGEMDQAIEMEPQNSLPLRIRGCIKGLAGNYEGALEDLDQALKLKPDDVLALVDRGVFRFLSGDLKGAVADLDQAIKHDHAQPADVLKLRDAIAKILADRAELAKLREENPKLKAELEAVRAKAAADLEAAQAKAAADLKAAQDKAATDLKAAQDKAAADLKAAQDKAAADLEALRVKMEAEAAEQRTQNQKLQEELNIALETLSKMPSNQTLELQYNNLCCEKCVRDIKAALSKVPGVESVEEDFMSSKVTVTGYVSASVILSVCRQTSPKKVIFIVGDKNAPEAAESAHDHEPSESTPAPPPAPEPAPAPVAAPDPAPAPEPPAAATSEPQPEPTPQTTAPTPESKPETTPAPAAPQPEPEITPKPAAPQPEPEITPEPAAPQPEPATAPEQAPEPIPEPAATTSGPSESEAETAPAKSAPKSETAPVSEPEAETAPGTEAGKVEAKPEASGGVEPEGSAAAEKPKESKLDSESAKP